MRGLHTLMLVVAVLVYSVESRERLGKVVHKRQARHRDYRTIGSGAAVQPQAVVPQAVVTGSFAKEEAAVPQAFTDTQGRQSPQRVNVLLGSPAIAQQQGFQQQAAPINHQPLFNARPVAPQYNQPPQATAFNQQASAAAYGQHPQPAAINPQPQQAAVNQQAQYNQASPNYPQPVPAATYQQPQVSPVTQYRPVVPTPQHRQTYQPQHIVDQVLKSQPAHAQLVAVRQSGRSIPLADRLISNATLIRPNIVDGFSCQGKIYGYYADPLNDCQIFHVCYPLKSVFQNDPSVPDVTYDFSFICNEFTRFSQDSMTCAWQYEAVPCEYAEELYKVNEAFFKTPTAAAPVPGPLGGYELP